MNREKSDVAKKVINIYESDEYVNEKRERRKKNGLLFIEIYLLCTLVSFIFYSHGSDPSLNIAMIYTLGVFLVARYSSGYYYGMLFAVSSVISVNFFFTYPYGNLNFSMEGYQLTFAGMLIIAFITSAMTTNMKQQAKELDNQAEEIANHIKATTGEAGRGECADYKISWKSQTRRTFDSKRFARENPDIDLSSYYNSSSSRVFRVTESKGA